MRSRPPRLEHDPARRGPWQVYRYFDNERHARALCLSGEIFVNTLEAWALMPPPRGDRLEGFRESAHTSSRAMICDGQVSGEPGDETAIARAEEWGILSIGNRSNISLAGNTFRNVSRPKCWGLSCALKEWHPDFARKRGTEFCVRIQRIPSFAFHLGEALARDSRCHTWSRWSPVAYGNEWKDAPAIESVFRKPADPFAPEQEFRFLVFPSDGQETRVDLDIRPRLLRVPALARLCSPVNFALRSQD